MGQKIHAGLEIHTMNQNLNMRIFLFLVFRQQKCTGQLFLTFLHYFHDFFRRESHFHGVNHPKNRSFLAFLEEFPFFYAKNGIFAPWKLHITSEKICYRPPNIIKSIQNFFFHLFNVYAQLLRALDFF